MGTCFENLSWATCKVNEGHGPDQLVGGSLTKVSLNHSHLKCCALECSHNGGPTSLACSDTSPAIDSISLITRDYYQSSRLFSNLGYMPSVLDLSQDSKNKGGCFFRLQNT